MNKLSTGSLNQFRHFRISPSSMWISVSLLACASLLVSCIEQMERPTEGYVEVNPGVEIYFERVGDGPEVVVIPGGMYLREEFAVLASPARTLLFLDQRGRGRSSQIKDTIQLGMDQEIADIEAIRAHFEIEQIALIGWSYGGGVVALYALRHPEHVTRLVQIGAMPPRKVPYWSEYLEINAARRNTSVQSRLTTLREAVSNSGGPEQRRAYWHLFHEALKYNPDTELRFRNDYYTLQNEMPGYVFEVPIAAIFASIGDWDWRTELGGIKVPVLTIHGDYDSLPLAGAREWVAVMPNAQLRIIPQAGHFPWAENPDAVFPAIDQFLSRRQSDE